jgi:arylsulfatase A-like enzyme
MKKRSLVLVTVDCLRADHVGFLGYSRPVTPNLDALAENSVVFWDAIVAGTPTYFSFPAILASRYPLALGRDVLGIAPHEPTVASVLQEAGYATAAFLAGNPYLSRRFGYANGFDSFHDFLDSGIGGECMPPNHTTVSNLNRLIQASSRRNGLAANAYDELYFWYCQWRSTLEDISMETLRRYPPANVMVDQARSWLSSLGEQPFFLWVHLMDPHNPYYPPEESLASLRLPPITARRARFLNSFWNRWDIGPQRLQQYRAEILSLYDAGVYWVDKQLSRLVGALQHFQRWDETVFVVTADHGETFLEHGDRYHAPTSLLEHLIHVPLLLRVPGLSGRRLLQGPFSQIHLAPTMLDAVGVPWPDCFQGRSCWDQLLGGNLRGEPAITECIDGCCNPIRPDDRMRPRLMAVRDDEFKLVINFREKQDYLYDLKNDPGEYLPLPPGVQTPERIRLLQAAQRHFQTTSDSQKHFRLRALLRELQQSVMTGDNVSVSHFERGAPGINSSVQSAG